MKKVRRFRRRVGLTLPPDLWDALQYLDGRRNRSRHIESIIALELRVVLYDLLVELREVSAPSGQVSGVPPELHQYFQEHGEEWMVRELPKYWRARLERERSQRLAAITERVARLKQNPYLRKEWDLLGGPLG